jgi:hypothetical protein
MHGRSMIKFIIYMASSEVMACLYAEYCNILVYKSLERNGTDICYYMKFGILTALSIQIMVI